MVAKKAVGHHGSWFAVVGGESLPCVHDYWWVAGALYNDTGLQPIQKANDLVDAIMKKKRVILTKDKPTLDPDGKLAAFERTGYVAIYSVDEVEFDAAGLRFKFVKRLEDLE